MQHAAHYSLLFILLVFLLMSLFVPKKMTSWVQTRKSSWSYIGRLTSLNSLPLEGQYPLPSHLSAAHVEGGRVDTACDAESLLDEFSGGVFGAPEITQHAGNE